MRQHERERLEYGQELRKSTDFIKCRAIVEFDDRTNSQEVRVDIPPGKINAEGYVEEIWVASDSVFIHREEVNEVKHALLHPNYLVVFNKARIDRIKVFEQKPLLLPSPDLIVRYRIPHVCLPPHEEVIQMESVEVGVL